MTDSEFYKSLSFPGQGLFTVPQVPLPDGVFLLPVCTTRDRLHQTLSVLWEGRFLKSDDAHNPNYGRAPYNIDHMADILEAMAYINNPAGVPCFEIDNCEDGCQEFAPNSAIVVYSPNDPFRTPTLIPNGYSIPPWYTSPTIPLPGVLPTDAMVNGAAILSPNLPASGFPRFRVYFEGSGEIEIEFVQVAFGGMALISVDGSLSSLKLVDLASEVIDVISLEGLLGALGIETEDVGIVQTQTIEVEIATPGSHYIDVTFLPSLGGETLIGFGGGIRRISLCGVSVPMVMPTTIFRLSPECVLEFSSDGGETFTPIQGWEENKHCLVETQGDSFADQYKCRKAHAIVNGLWERHLNPMLTAVRLGIEGEVGDVGIRALAKERWFSTLYDTTQETLFNFMVQNLIDLDSPEGQLLELQEIAGTEANRRDIAEGLYCWMCDNGALDIGDIDNLKQAWVSVLGLAPYYTRIWLDWLTFAMENDRNEFLSLVAAEIEEGACDEDCNLSCAEWEANLSGQWSVLFDFLERSNGWFPTVGGSNWTDYEGGEGWRPHGTPAGSGNFSCVGIRSDIRTMALKTVYVEMSYEQPFAIRFDICLRRVSDGGFDCFDQVFNDPQRNFELQLDGTIEYDQVQIGVYRHDASCTLEPDFPVRLSLVELAGNGLNPWVGI